jgi:hypothetical protein
MGSHFSAHTLINLILYLGSAGMFFAGLAGKETQMLSSRKLWIAGLIIWLTYPVLTEILMNIKAKLAAKSTRKSAHQCLKCIEGERGIREILPIVFHNRYNITFCGLEKVHPFDSQKYGRVY